MYFLDGYLYFHFVVLTRIFQLDDLHLSSFPEDSNGTAFMDAT